MKRLCTKRPLESGKSYPGSALVLWPSQAGGEFCLLFPAFNKCCSSAGHRLASVEAWSLTIEAQDSCEGGTGCLDCRPRKLWGFSKLGQMPQEEGVLPQLQSCFRLPTAWDWSTSSFLFFFLFSSPLPSVCTGPAIKPSHSEGKGAPYCTADIRQQVT